MPRTGRPKKEIDFKILEGLCRIQCTEEEIAGVLEVSVDTINRKCKVHYGCTFAEASKRFADLGKVSIRRSQFKMAETNCTMAIWLGKQYLGQTDKVESKVEQGSFTVRIHRPDDGNGDRDA